MTSTTDNSGDDIYFSGQTAKNAINAPDLTGDIPAQTKQISNAVVKVNVYLTTMKNFRPFDDYPIKGSEAFNKSCICVTALDDPEVKRKAKSPSL